MRGLTLWQPWASLLALEAKVHETRSWPTKYRGPLLIHASVKWDLRLARLCFEEPFFAVLHAAGVPFPARVGHANQARFLPLGVVLAVADLVDCQPTPEGNTIADWPNAAQPANRNDFAFGDWSPGRYAWRLGNVRRLDAAVPWKGSQGFWTPPDELLDQCFVEGQSLRRPARPVPTQREFF